DLAAVMRVVHDAVLDQRGRVRLVIALEAASFLDGGDDGVAHGGVSLVEGSLELWDAAGLQPGGCRPVGGILEPLGVLGGDPRKPATAELHDVGKVLTDVETAYTVAVVQDVHVERREHRAVDAAVAFERIEDQGEFSRNRHSVPPEAGDSGMPPSWWPHAERRGRGESSGTGRWKPTSARRTRSSRHLRRPE